MSKLFPTEKDNIIDDFDEQFKLELTDDEYDRLRKMSAADLFLLTILFLRALKASKSEQ